MLAQRDPSHEGAEERPEKRHAGEGFRGRPASGQNLPLESVSVSDEGKRPGEGFSVVRASQRLSEASYERSSGEDASRPCRTCQPPSRSGARVKRNRSHRTAFRLRRAERRLPLCEEFSFCWGLRCRPRCFWFSIERNIAKPFANLVSAYCLKCYSRNSANYSAKGETFYGATGSTYCRCYWWQIRHASSSIFFAHKLHLD